MVQPVYGVGGQLAGEGVVDGGGYSIYIRPGAGIAPLDILL